LFRRHQGLRRFTREDMKCDYEELARIILKAALKEMNGKPLQFILYQGDCRKIMPLIPDGCIDLIITSPPYYKLKTFSNVEGEIGTKGSVSQYVRSLIQVFEECYRVLKPNGLMMLNIDSGKREAGMITISAWDWIQPLRRMGFGLVQTIIWVDTNGQK